MLLQHGLQQAGPWAQGCTESWKALSGNPNSSRLALCNACSAAVSICDQQVVATGFGALLLILSAFCCLGNGEPIQDLACATQVDLGQHTAGLLDPKGGYQLELGQLEINATQPSHLTLADH